MTPLSTFTTLAATIAIAIAAPASAKTTHFLIDESESNRAVSDPAFTRLVARQSAVTVLQQTLGDRISVRTFGNINDTNPLRYDVQLTRRSTPPRAVARAVSRLILRSGAPQGQRQQRTEIVAALQWNRYDCAAGDHIIVLTDGIETGAVRSPTALLNGREALPRPRSGFLRGCTISFWGIGRVSSGELTSAQVNNLRSAWASYFRIAGARFNAVPNP